MYCENCGKEIPVGENYFDLGGHTFCSSECVTDHLIYTCRLSIETNNGEDDEDSEEEED